MLERADHRCEFCGIENYTNRDGARIVLTVAHLDHDATNWEIEIDRLRALCQRCHIRYDKQGAVQLEMIFKIPEV